MGMMIMMSNKVVQLVTLAAMALVTPISATHYEQPPCQADELAVRMSNVEGTFCSSSCAKHPCPTDVPVGVKLEPQCALQSPTGEKYCAILCNPADAEGLPCGPVMQCATIPGSPQGVFDYVTSEAEANVDSPASLIRGGAPVVHNVMLMTLASDVDVDVAIDVIES